MQHQSLNPKHRLNKNIKEREYKKTFFDAYNIIKFFVLWLFFTIIAIWTKVIVLTSIEESPTHQVGNDMLTLSEVHNTGAAFGLFAGQQDAIITISGLTILVIAFIVIMASKKIPHSALPAMAFLNTGIALNMVERIQYGYVIDYINFNFVKNFPVFNVPDIMVVIGTICIIVSIITRK